MTLQKAKVRRDLERDGEDFIEKSTHKSQKIWSESWMVRVVQMVRMERTR